MIVEYVLVIILHLISSGFSFAQTYTIFEWGLLSAEILEIL